MFEKNWTLFNPIKQIHYKGAGITDYFIPQRARKKMEKTYSRHSLLNNLPTHNNLISRKNTFTLHTVIFSKTHYIPLSEIFEKYCCIKAIEKEIDLSNNI